MVEYDESIYNLIPKEQYVPQKPKRYRSQYPPNMAPTASTFGLKTTSKPVCSNLSGKFNLEGGAHSHQANGATFGAAKGTLKPDTTVFRKKGTGNPVLIPKTEGKWPFPGKTVPPAIAQATKLATSQSETNTIREIKNPHSIERLIASDPSAGPTLVAAL